MKNELLKEGDLIEITEEHEFYGQIPKHFCYANERGNWELTNHKVRAKEFKYFIGRYVVTKTTKDGGGTGHGPNDIYPDGHHVWCEKTSGERLKIDFYQTGAFTAMIKHIKPIGKAKLQWVESA